jgi:hypothetical protein
LVRAGAAPNDTASSAIPEVRAGAGDPVGVALALSGPLAGGRTVRVVRDGATAADSAWARAGNAVVTWPIATPAEWSRRAAVDTAFAVATVGPGAATVIAPFIRVAEAPAGRVVARWSDGDPAVTEAALGAGCVRAVTVGPANIGDLALTPAFRRFVERLAAPCGGARQLRPAPDSVLSEVLPATIAVDAVGPVAVEAGEPPQRRLVAWLLGLALATAVAEMFVRRGGSHAAA